jgi:solute carrier family 25 (mitochondrial S-adenosylmethionine transporter), member 26
LLLLTRSTIAATRVLRYKHAQLTMDGIIESSYVATAPSFLTALVAGGVAGTSVDVALFPIDTLKTRAQAPAGFWKAGGFRGIYNGIGAAAAGSAPGAALFFSTYEALKPMLASQPEHRNGQQPNETALCHMIAASVAEAAACLVRVPTEVIKAKMQTASIPLSLSETVRVVVSETHGGGPLSGLTGGLYRGYGITLFREIPFAIIQFPLYEWMKVEWKEYQGSPCSPLQAAACGSGSGAVAAAFTTPLDVLKTRHMIGFDHNGRAYTNIVDVFRTTLNTDGPSAFWKGIQPRVMWITIGGFVFFGSYEAAKSMVSPILG